MPRASGSGKRQLGVSAGHRDTRHENGIVGPGRRISAKKSHGQLDGSARLPDHGAGHAGPSSSLPSSSLPSSSLSPPPPPPPRRPTNCLVNGAAPCNGRPDDAPAAAALFSAPSSGLDNQSVDALRRDSLGTFSEASSDSCRSSSSASGGGSVVVDGSHRHIDISALKNVDVHRDSGLIELATTIVRSLPVQDTLAILVILMHIPYLSLTLVYACFASLTFVPPVASKAGWNINFGDMFDGNSHTPSLATVVCMDFFFFLIWVFLWPPIQDFMLEFAKPVIAVTLGGGTSAKDGTSRGVTACFTWVLLHKLTRASRSYWPRVARHVPDAWRMAALVDSFHTTTPALYDKRDTHAWIQSILAMHILTQGIMRYIREWYVKREKRFNTTAGVAGDPEAGRSSTTAGSGGSTAVVGTSAAETAAHDANFITPDAEAGHPPVHPPTAMTKKKRKQSAQVRLQQPLWAALASTKIVAMKEIELSSWGSGSMGSDKRDIHNSGNAPSFDRRPKQIWISYIGSDEVCFSTSHFSGSEFESAPLAPSSSNVDGHAVRPDGVDTSKPFYVRINNAFWQPTRIFSLDESGDDFSADRGPRWTGDIYGLRPASKYVCEFVDSKTEKLLFRTSIRTVKEPLREHDPISSPDLPNGQRQPLRPDSPATTLRTSISAAEVKLTDEKNRLKAWRKEWKLRINSLKKENELADNQLSSAGNSDEKYKQKIRQQETQKAQAERDATRLSERLKDFDTAPELAERKRKAERAYSTERMIFDAAQREFKEHKSQLENEVKTMEVDKSNLNTRRNKIATRIAKVENELANIADANNRGLDEAERRLQERLRWLEQVAAIEHNYSERFGHVLAGNSRRREHLRSLQAQLRAMQGYLSPVKGVLMDVNPAAVVAEPSRPPFLQQSYPWNPNPSAPLHYPGKFWAASSGDILPPTSAPSRTASMTAWQAPPIVPAFEPRSAKARARSSSMLSDVSGFTQPSADGSRSPLARMKHYTQLPCGGRNGARGSSGSGSSGSGSAGDPASPS